MGIELAHKLIGLGLGQVDKLIDLGLRLVCGLIKLGLGLAHRIIRLGLGLVYGLKGCSYQIIRLRERLRGENVLNLDKKKETMFF